MSAAITPTYVHSVPHFYELEDEADALRFLAAYVEHVAARGADQEEVYRTRNHASALFAGWRLQRARAGSHPEECPVARSRRRGAA